MVSNRPPRSSPLRGGVLSAFANRDFSVLWSGAFISNVGTWIQTAALLWYIKVLTGSNAWVGWVNFASYLPVLFLSLYAGSLADYLDRKKLILVGQSVMMVDAFALAIATTVGVANLPVIMVISTVMGIATALLLPAWQSIMPDLVPPRDLLNAVALNAAQFNLARFVGPALGAIIISVWSAGTAFYINGVSFLFVIGAILLVRTHTPSVPMPEEGRLRHMGAAFTHVWRNRYMFWLLVVITVVAFFGFSVLVLMPAVAKDVFHRGAGSYGLILGLYGLGAAIGAPLVTWLDDRFDSRNVIRGSAVALGVVLIAFGLSQTYWLICVTSIGFGGSFMVLASAINATLQGNSEREMRGRVSSLFIMLLVGGFPIGGQLLAYLSELTSTEVAILVGGGVCLATGIALLVFPSLTMRGQPVRHDDRAARPEHP